MDGARQVIRSSLIALALLTAGPAIAKDFTYDINVIHYTIRGSDGLALAAQMNKRGPKTDPNSKHRAWAAIFTSLVDGTYSPCYLHFKVDMILPRWVDYPKATAKDKALWDAFYSFAEHHEYQHVGHLREQEAYIKEHKCEGRFIGLALLKAHGKDATLDEATSAVPPPALYDIGETEALAKSDFAERRKGP